MSIKAGSRPVSGKNPSAGPPFTQSGGVWQVNNITPTLRNTVTDADGDESTLSFEVWTVGADGKPKDQVSIDDDNQWGVGVSKPVASGKTAEYKVPWGKLSPGTTYMFHTSGFDGSLYETDWSPWAKFKLRERAVDLILPAPDKTLEPLNQDDYQEPQKIPQPNVVEVPPTEPPIGRSVSDGWSCGEVKGKTGIQPCTRVVPDNSKKTRDALAKAHKTKSADLVDWCSGLSFSHIKRYEACISSMNYEFKGIVVVDNKPTGEVLNANWAFSQQFKLSSNTAAIQEKLTLVPIQIDAKLLVMTLNVEFDCLPADKCTTDNSSQAWDGALEWPVGDFHKAEGTITHNWNAADNSRLLDLSTKITGYSAKSNPSAKRWQADGAQIRCDKISSTKPGCTFYKYIPTWTFNTKKVPAAAAHAWLIQSKLPNHPGSKKDNKPMFFLPQASKNAHNRDPRANAAVICPTGWARNDGHPAATALDSTDIVSCDEYAFAASYNSGGMPSSMSGMNQVSSGNACLQTFARKLTSSGNWHLFDDDRMAPPTYKEQCGRSAMSGWVNSTSMGGAFSSGFSVKYRLLDQDPYWVDTPGFENCDASTATVKCDIR